jgi:hypothetical protein
LKKKIFSYTYITDLPIDDCICILNEERSKQSKAGFGMHIHIKKNGSIMLSYIMFGLMPLEFRMKISLKDVNGKTEIMCQFNPYLCNFTCGVFYTLIIITIFGLIKAIYTGAEEVIGGILMLCIFVPITFFVSFIALKQMKSGGALLFKDLLNASPYGNKWKR